MGSGDDLQAGTGGCKMCLAIPGKIVEIAAGERGSAMVDVVGVRRRVDLGLLQDDPPSNGDWVLIHVGFAMSKISEQEAMEQMRILELLGEAEAAVQEVSGYEAGEISQPDEAMSSKRATS